MEPSAAQTLANKTDAMTILARHGQLVCDYLASLRGRWPDAPPALLDAMDYSIKAGGKRLRPALVLECAEVAAANAVRAGPGRAEGRAHGVGQTPSASALAAAGAIELIHTFSLVHDDLPAMDDDDLRRGMPTNHKVFGEAMAILAGDAMVTGAFELMAAEAEPRVVPALIRELAHASGPEGMIGGQVLDMDGETQSLGLDELQRVHRMKTGALLTCACRLGVISAGAGGARVLETITEYGRHLGLAFQIVDDVLDVTATAQQLGKATNKDAGRGKNTYPGLMGLEASRDEAARQLRAALEALNGLGESADGLRAVARFVGHRNI